MNLSGSFIEKISTDDFLKQHNLPPTNLVIHLEIGLRTYSRAFLTDLLERDVKPLPHRDGKVRIDLRANGLAAIRLMN